MSATKVPPTPGSAPSTPSIPERPASKGGLNAKQRQEVIALATLVPFRPRAILYRENAAEAFIFVCADGVLKSYRDLPSGRRRVFTFRYPGDLFGLAEAGRYVNTVQAVTSGSVYRIPIEPLHAKLRQDGDLQFQVLTRVTQELREAQRQSIVLSRRSADGRIAMFLKQLQGYLAAQSIDLIPLPMSRSDIAAFLGLTLESVSRGMAKLTRNGIVAPQGQRYLQIVSQKKLDALAADV